MTNAKSASKTRANATTIQPPAVRKAKAAAAAALKTAAQAAPTPAVESSATAAASRHRPSPKLVRDSFTIPKTEYSVLEGLKVRAANLTRPVKKSELLRAGIAVLSTMSDKAFLAALKGVPSLKTGRPKGLDAPSPSDVGPK
jgi:hypothetical protein